MNRRAIVLLVVALVLAGSRTRSLEFEAPQKDPFSFFGPAIQVDADERKRLADGKTIAAILPAHDHELAVLAAGSTTATADALVNAVKHIVRLEKGSFIPEIGRFSKHPRVQDLATLTLDPIDLDAIKTCRPGACDLKLTAPEIDRLHRIVSAHPANPKHAVESEFRRIIVDRVTAYLRRWQRGIAPYGNGDDKSLDCPERIELSIYGSVDARVAEGGGARSDASGCVRRRPLERLEIALATEARDDGPHENREARDCMRNAEDARARSGEPSKVARPARIELAAPRLGGGCSIP